MDIVFVGIRSNKNWILGNWTNEIAKRLPLSSRKLWFPTAFAKGRLVERIYPKHLPKSQTYFFSYPTLFAPFADSSRVGSRAIVLYTHNELPELGSDIEQVELLNKAYSVHFFSSRDAKRLVDKGLVKEKVRIVNGAVDLDLPTGLSDWEHRRKLIVLASKFGVRKGAEKLPDLVKLLDDWNFLILGRGWEEFLIKEGLSSKSTVEYGHLNKESRNSWFPKAKIFLSLSNLEGGPIPLLEACHTGAMPIVSDTGFARDILGDFANRSIFSINAKPHEVAELVKSAQDPHNRLRERVAIYSWDRLTRIVFTDVNGILNNSRN